MKAAFETQWRRLGGPELEGEFVFSSIRDWRFDYAHLPSLIAIELEGGTWNNGAHVRGEGYTKDCTKYNAAIHLNWRVFRFTTDMIANDPFGHLLPVVELMRAS